MAPIRKILIVICVLALVMLACGMTVDLGNWPGSAPTQGLSVQSNVSTSVAQTLQAFTQQALTANAANTPTVTASATSTTIPVPPTLSVSVATNCYIGPNTNYGFVITIYPGTTVTVVGRDAEDNYWIIDVPGYPGSICWLSGQYASVMGDLNLLPAPVTPVVSIYTLSEPRNLRISCSSETNSSNPHQSPGDEQDDLTVYLHWTNTEPDQTGVRIYRNGWLIDTLRAGATSYTDSFTRRHRHYRDDLTYGVQAFNYMAVSSIVTIEVRGCD